MIKQVLLIGRFQPLCKNHLDLFEQAKDLGDYLLIGVGRPDYSKALVKLSSEDFEYYKLSYVFSFEKTKEWINSVLESTPHTIVPVRDIFSRKEYATHVMKTFEERGVCLEDCLVLGENDYTYECFDKFEIIVAEDRTGYHASDVREEIRRKGSSDKVAVRLTPEEVRTIQEAEMKKETLKNNNKAKYITYSPVV